MSLALHRFWPVAAVPKARSSRVVRTAYRIDLHAANACIDLSRAAESGAEQRGTPRLNVSSAADRFLSGAVLGGFLRRYPEIRLELFVGDSPSDIVAEGYDAAVRLGEVIDQDMITVPVSDPLGMVVVGSPAYLARPEA